MIFTFDLGIEFYSHHKTFSVSFPLKSKTSRSFCLPYQYKLRHVNVTQNQQQPRRSQSQQ